MKKVLFWGALLGLLSISNVFASESDNVNVPIETVNETNAYVDNVNYSVTNVHTESDYGGPCLYFTVNWEYTGNRPNTSIAFMVYIWRGSSLEKSFLDSAPYGSKVGSKDYKIKVDRDTNYQIFVDGSDGGPAR